ncbi:MULTISPECIES: hypothetical protein [unclassified Cyanobium]|uniref:hypothetical protein n=1 Tax=unclassified Cyanobium TaxID=2627006 RepID=UPI0020CB7DFB|nr:MULTISPECIES: hypothetical protein [unclassified Cyanobium]MCP9835457.1 hypothetical protein [Cyanobium sp. La Preciosa 7G6]MCP9938223.1 hypothetical protein [Cyanobium sp. Aljojuca 7A6]
MGSSGDVVTTTALFLAFNGMGPQRGFQLPPPGIRCQHRTCQTSASQVPKGVERMLLSFPPLDGEGGWGGITTPGAGLAAAAMRSRQKGSQQGLLPDGPPKTKPGPVARQPPGFPHAPAPSTTYQRLREYIAKQMRMSHIDQPLMLMELLGRSSPAPAQDVARRILGEDVTQIEYYTERVKRMVGKVLTRNGITAYGNGAYSLIGGDELSDAERDALQPLCRQRLDAFREQRGEEVFAHRSRHRSQISDSVKYQVLTGARGRCECCGAH